jgi:hypothetical protein
MMAYPVKQTFERGVLRLVMQKSDESVRFPASLALCAYYRRGFLWA